MSMHIPFTHRLKMLTLGALAVSLAALLAGCGQLPGSSPTRALPGGDPTRGLVALQEYGCTGCHTIPGVPRAEGVVGPPLENWANRRMIAGRFANTPENLVQFLISPQAVNPGSGMPDMGVSTQDALDISAFLYTLRRGR